MTAPVSFPLKVRERKGRVWAEDATGRTVVDGRTREHWPERYVATTGSGTCRVAASVDGGAEPYLPVIDAAGREIARVVTARREWTLRLATGESVAISSGGNMFTGLSCTIGEWSKAVAPRLAPQRYFTLTVDDAVLGRPDRDALLAALVWISESRIANLITEAGGAD
jgi:hypothetical protein